MFSFFRRRAATARLVAVSTEVTAVTVKLIDAYDRLAAADARLDAALAPSRARWAAEKAEKRAWYERNNLPLPAHLL